MRRLLLVIAILCLIAPQRCLACLWDYDTLAMERQRFPEAHELIAGLFIRHSDAYYEWRIENRTAKPIDEHTPIDFDDIAVAYDKLGEHDKAIETIRTKLERWQNERIYESEANLGTFHIHAGRFKEGVAHIKKAIKINPDAHFGREKYQQLLVEYVIESSRSDKQLPLSDKPSYERSGFAEFILAAEEAKFKSKRDEIQAAAKGIMGMMRFGQHDSPILLEALGDLLLYDEFADDSKMLAARAYLKASYEVDDASASSAYREKAQWAIEMQSGVELSDVEADLKREIERGNEFFQQIVADEQSWIAAGKNLDAAFSEKYYETPLLAPNLYAQLMERYGKLTPTTFGGLAILILMIGVIAMRRMRPKNSTPAE